MKKIKLILTAFAIFLLIIIIATPTTYASGFISEIEGQANQFIEQGKSGNTANLDSFGNAAVGVGQVLTTIGLAVVMVGYLVLGIKYMMASPEEAGKIKGQLVGLTVSALVIFGAWGIWNAVVLFFQSLE